MSVIKGPMKWSHRVQFCQDWGTFVGILACMTADENLTTKELEQYVDGISEGFAQVLAKVRTYEDARKTSVAMLQKMIDLLVKADQ